MLVNIPLKLAYDLPRTEDVGLPNKFRFNVGSASQPIARLQIVYNAGPMLRHHWVCCILCANTWHLTDAVLMLTHSLRSWPDIEITLGDCTVFSYCCMRVTMQVTRSIPAPQTPDNTIHWPSADVMLGPCLRRWFSFIPIKTS